jgi:hypothetical protein
VLSNLVQQFERSTAARPDTLKRRAEERSFTANVPGRPDLVTFPVAVKEEGEGLLISTGEVVAQFPEGVTPDQVRAFVTPRNWTISRTLPFMSNGYVLSATTSADTFEFANQLVEQAGAKFAHPVFLEDIPERAVARAAAERAVAPEISPASAQLYQRQWHLDNTGQAGSKSNVDINAADAWRITFGSNKITACIIDSGVNLSHESFNVTGKLLPGYDFADNDAFPAAVDSSHGTACSALIGAYPGAGQVIGVAPACRIMPIRRPTLSNHLGLAESFAWAADHSADVISCSFGIDGQPWILPDVVREALDYATTHGRQGRGCPIFWAAGNGSELVTPDEWASSPHTIAVAASTDQGTKASYSDFGPEILICAPSSGGVNGIVTAVNNGYTTQFGGTSAAAPIAAGVACLVLSVSPNMRWTEVRDLFRRTAKVIDAPGGQYDNTGHSPYYGYGQVDAMQALLGIDCLVEAERATNTTSLHGPLTQFFSYLERNATGRIIKGYVASRRLSLMVAIQRDSLLLDALGRIIRLLADLGSRLSTGQPLVIPDEIWPSVEQFVRTLQSLATLNPGFDRSERSIEPIKENNMPNETTTLDEALNRLATIMGGPTPQPSGTSTGTSGTTGTSKPAPNGSPATKPAAPAGTDQREEIAKQVFYSMGVRPITREDLIAMEAGIPALIERLKALKDQPTYKSDLQQLIGALVNANGGTERDVNAQARATALAELISKDAFGEGERILPLIGVAIGAFMAGYTVAHNWGR